MEAGIPKTYLVDPPTIQRTISEYLADEGITMFAVSETQKCGHVKYVWNGNRSGYIDDKLETYVEIPSDRIPFDQAPAMQAEGITQKVIDLLHSGNCKFGRLNFANGDVVGHTGVLKASIEAVETVNGCIKRLLAAVRGLEGIAVVTSDHGNVDKMFVIKKGKKTPKAAHSLNRVPFVIVDFGCGGAYQMAELESPGLSNVAATICNLLGSEKPDDYDPSLIDFD